MTVATFVQPNFTTQSAAAYKAAIDAAIAVLATMGGDYACHAKDTPDMQVLVDAGQLFLADSTLVINAQQTSATITAPVTNPRIDRIVINDQTGVVSVIAGTEAASPTAPAITAGTRPVAQILLQTSSTVITNSMITDERVVVTFDVSTFIRTLLDDADAATARATLAAAALGANTFTADQTINGLTVGRGTGSIAGNSIFGSGALSSNTTGNYNSAIGSSALSANTTGTGNSAFGNSALIANTTGSGNSAINPLDSAGNFAPIFNPVAENNRFCAGSTGVTNAYIQVAWTVVSDARDKTNIGDVPHGLDFVSRLKPVSYQFKMSRDDEKPHGPVRYGFLAQDVLALEGANPVVIDAEDTEKLRMVDQHLIAIMVNAIQELQAKNQQLENRLTKAGII